MQRTFGIGGYSTVISTFLRIVARSPVWCLTLAALMALRNKAMACGVWCQIYAFLGVACAGLLVALLW